MASSLSVSHFKLRNRVPLAAMLPVRKLSAQLGDACAKALGRISQAPWRVIPDGIDEGLPLAAAPEITLLRFESELGGLTAYLWLERQAVSAVMEAALGGMGTEVAFTMPERSLSRIELGVVQLATTGMSQELMLVLSREFARTVSLLDGDRKVDLPEDASQLVSFRYVVNLFDYSGELRITMARDELLHQMGSPAEAESATSTTAKKQLQVEIERSELTLTVSLGPEVFSVEELSTLTPGRLLELTSTASMPVTVWSSGVAAYQGTLARAGDRLAVCLTAAVS